MKTRWLSVLAGLLVLMAALPSRADDAALAPFISDTTLIVTRFHLGKVDLNAVETWRQAIFKQAMGNDTDPVTAHIAATLPMVQQALDALNKAGGTTAYIIFDLVLPKGLTSVMVVPLPAGADTADLSALLLKHGGAAPDPSLEAATIQNALVYGPSEMVDRLKTAKASDRPEMMAALAAGGDAPVEISFAPTLPFKFMMMAAASSTPGLGAIMQNASWMTLSAMLPPNESLHLAISAKDADGATAVVGGAKTLLVALRAKPANGPLADALTPVQNGNMVNVDLDTATMEKTVAPILVTVVKDSIARNKILQSMGNMRQLVIGCLMYSQANQGQWPNKLDDIAPNLPNFKDLIINPTRPGVTPGYVYVKPDAAAATQASPTEVILLYEPADGDKPVSIGFEDGHVQSFSATQAAVVLKDVQK